MCSSPAYVPWPRSLALGCGLAQLAGCFSEDPSSTTASGVTPTTTAAVETSGDAPSTSGRNGSSEGEEATTSGASPADLEGDDTQSASESGQVRPCIPQARTYDATADTHITAGNCYGANYGGGSGHVTLSPSFRGLLRFDLDAEVVSAWEEGRVESVALTLHRTDDCEGTPCGAVGPGTLVARPLRVEWDEGPAIFTGHEGADWCRRTGVSNSGLPWGESGASKAGEDVLAPSGEVAIATREKTITIDLDPEAHLGLLDLGSARVAIALWAGPNQASFFFTARSHEASTRDQPSSQLTLTYCP